jgi:antitoxin VapB
MATAKIVMDGRDQTIVLPDEFRFGGTEVDIRRDQATGGVILVEKPARTGSWDAFVEAVKAVRPEDIPDDFFERDQGVQERDDPLA